MKRVREESRVERKEENVGDGYDEQYWINRNGLWRMG